MDPESEMKAREVFAHKGLSVVGWYHSHPTFEPNPSVRDIEYQQLYQVIIHTLYNWITQCSTVLLKKIQLLIYVYK